MALRIQMHFTGQLARAAGERERVLEVPDGSTLGDLILALARGEGGEFASLLLDAGGRPRSTTLRVVDGQQIPPGADGLALEDGAEVMLMTPIAGG
ncbi:MAG: MoaD/ThiS family protein [Verrucomicrobia bacterium]|nr:MoaD/ThiS family protein [Verrucomicrobiota bacterium]